VILYRCYAKVNLTLEVLGRRPDGYHELRSLAHTIGLADDLRIAAADEALVSRADGLAAEAEADENLVSRAAELLRDWSRTRAGAELTLVKRIPVAAGLGGGSSDAATTLVGLNRLWRTRLPQRELSALAARLGSDVPFFLRGGAAVLSGRGEQVEPVRPLSGQWLTLAVLPHAVANKTTRLYAALGPTDYTDGRATQGQAAALTAGRPLDASNLQNAFSRVAQREFGGLAAAWALAEQTCGRSFHLSGAGPALFALAMSRDDARGMVPVLERLGLRAFATRTVARARASAQVAGPGSIGYP
jgi:4-diphosphocytidyl-2-C-methyl-D-erythritol kinase